MSPGDAGERVHEWKQSLNVAAAYLILLGLGTIAGLVAGAAPVRDNHLEMPVLAGVIAGALLLTGFGLVWKRTWARHAFFLMAAPGALALASAHPARLWSQDLPYTIVLAAVFGILVLVLSRAPSLRVVGYTRSTFGTRGGTLLLLLTIAAGAALLILQAQEPAPRGGGLGALGGTAHDLNTHVKHLAVCYLLIWHGVAGLVAASVPSRERKGLPS